jgi:hypothetical protein
VSLEHSPARQEKSAGGALEPLYTRDEVAARWRVQPQHITRNYARLGLRPIRVGKRQLFTESNIIAVERRATSAA